jgi:hypothetical protein
MKIKALIITAQGAVSVQEIERSLESFQGIVGGYIEGVDLPESSLFRDAPPGRIYCNEDGKVKGLPRNAKASKLCDMAGVGLMDGDYLVGTVLILGEVDEEGEDTSIPDELAAAIQDAI